ncbi:hypothetical protein HHI36_007452 [Cryptolaemus montrouzieri]|uniref:lysozyme n=1 Tax=Cryptolaemus montrouzieri TaxID=559131 RepID=A0ABD2MPQ0_9CUCU
MKPLIVVAIFMILSLSSIEAKVYGRCEFARELANLGVPRHQIPTWTCIAQRESNYDTAARNWGSGDHGILQISQLFWCNVDGGPGKGCNAQCSQFRNNNIVDDVRCAQKIFDEHTRISGDGFNAWTTYRFCRGDNNRYVAGCF